MPTLSWPFKRKPHRAMLGPTGVYYIFTFDLGNDANASKVASQLLRSGIAESANATSSPRVAVTPKFKSLLKNKRQALAISKFSDALENGRWLGILKESFRMPALGWMLAKQIFKHFFGVRRPLEKDAEDSRDVKEVIDEATSIIDNSMHSKLINRGFEHAVDEEIFAPGYLQNDPFIRLQLKPFQGHIPGQVTGDEPFANSKSWIDVDLVLHSSGIAQMHFSIAFDSSSLQERIRATAAKGVVISSVRICEEVLKPYARYERSSLRNLSGQRGSKIEGGTWWWTLSSKSPTTLTDIFDIYETAIKYCTKLQGGSSWICYTLMCIEELKCACRSQQEWMEHHIRELAGLVARVGWYERISETGLRRFLPDDLFESTSSSLHASLGSAVRINWDFSKSSTDPEYSHAENFRDLTVIGHSLFKYGQARRLDDEIRRTVLKGKHLDRQVKDFVNIRNYNDVLTYGTAREIAASVDRGLGIPELYQSIQTNLEMKREALVAVQAKKSSKRANITAATALVAAAVIALPNIHQGLEIIARVDTSKGIGILAKPLQDIAREGASGSWWLYLTVLAFFTITVVFPWSLRIRRRKKNVKFGWYWPEHISVRLAKDDENPLS
ncbi:hypothetical protein [Streptosporangium roseum]|nr:hypothetical protein [Streptosporangium roseum]